MGGRIDMIKGRIKEAVGALIDNNRLREEGRSEQAVAKVKVAAQTAVNKVKVTAQKTVRAAKETARQAVSEANVVAKKLVDNARSATMPMRGRST